MTVIAKIIGEKSAGLLALEIWRDGDLVWSHDYFARGANSVTYAQGLVQIIDDMLALADVDDFDGCDRDEDGEPVGYDCSATTLPTLSYDGTAWEYLGHDSMSAAAIAAFDLPCAISRKAMTVGLSRLVSIMGDPPWASWRAR